MSSQWNVSSSGRLDIFLTEQVEDASRTKLSKAIEAGFVEVNGEEILRSSFKVKQGDTVFLSDNWNNQPVSSSVFEPSDLFIEIIYEDDGCMVLNKPAGFAVHPGFGMEDGQMTILNGIAYLFNQRSLQFTASSVLVHRLDKDTTGCLLIAKNPQAHEILQKQFEQRTVSKKYLAITYGIPFEPKAIIDAPIGRSMTDRTKMSVLRTSKSRSAKTSYSVIKSAEDCSLLECDLHTGRTHQIRVHLSSINHPVLGDETYFSNLSKIVSLKYKAKSICLHSWKLKFISPFELKEISVEANTPASFKDVLLASSLFYSATE